VTSDEIPTINAETHRLADELWAASNVAAWCELFHPHRSRYVDPAFGEFRGRAAIQAWLARVMRRAGSWRSRNVGARLFDGFVAAGEAELVIPLEDGELVLPFAWIQRYEEGWIVYRRDYYDTHDLRRRASPRALAKPEAAR